MRTVCSREIEVKGALEKILRACVDDVKNEIAKKRAQGYGKRENAVYYAKSKREQEGLYYDGDKSLTQQEREKIIEVLLSQERVLTLLYDKTFPPRPATTSNVPGVNNRLFSAGGNNNAGTGADDDMLRQFNYYGGGGGGAPNLEDFTEADILKLEQEVEDLLKSRFN